MYDSFYSISFNLIRIFTVEIYINFIMKILKYNYNGTTENFKVQL